MLHDLWQSLAYGFVQLVVLLTICIVVEQIAVIERFTLRQRVPGFLFQALGGLIGGTLSFVMQQVWGLLGLGGLVVPLYRWLQPLPFGFAIYILAMLMINDFLVYWRHRAEHKWFWPIHRVHHSPRELHAANDIGHPLQTIPNFLFVWMPLSLIQMPGPATPAFIVLLTTLATMYIHSPIDFHFGPFRKVLVDNRFHRIHHSLETKHFDKNFSVCFSIWDRFFGTVYWPAKDEWPKVGVDGIPHPRTMCEFLKLPFTPNRSER